MFENKTSSWLRQIRLAGYVCFILFPFFAFADETDPVVPPENLVDTDGDLIPDYLDPMPMMANFPLYWQVKSFSITRVGAQSEGMAWAKQATFTISEAPVFVKLSFPSGETVSPSVHTSAAAERKQHTYERYGIAGSDTFKWGKTEKLRLARFSQGENDTDLQLNFTVHIINFSASKLFGEPVNLFQNICVPVIIGDKTWTTATLSNESAAKNGVVIPADGKIYPLDFSAVISAENADAFLCALTKSQSSPEFAISRSTGFFNGTEDPASYSLNTAYESIRARTSVIRIENLEGQQWSWYVAQKTPNGSKTHFADWIEAENALFVNDAGLPLINTFDMKYVTSVAGWDSGNWDTYWNVTSAGRKIEFGEWLDLALSRDIMINLVTTPPDISKKETRRLLQLENLSPTLASIVGASFWQKGDKNTAFDFFSFAAQNGAPNGMSWLGKYHSEREKFDDQDDPSALAAKSYKISADAKYAPGQAWYGRTLLLGDGVDANPTAAVEQLRLSSEQGFPEGMALYALCLLNGRGIARDSKLGIKLSEEAAKKGSTTAQIGLAVLLLNAKSEDGIDWLYVASELGSAKAMTRLGKVYRDGELGTEQNVSEAIRLFETAAAMEEPLAIVALGELYNSGTGVNRNTKKAAKLFRHAADMDNREGQTWYALCLLEGSGVPCNHTEAVQWLRKASDQKYALARYVLGVCLYSGVGCEKKDPVEAYKLFSSVVRTQPAAYIFMGNSHYTGNGAEKDPKKAFEMFQKAADAGLPEGDAWLAFCYGNGIGVKQNAHKAKELARKAIDAGCAGALGILRSLPQD